MLCVCVCVCVMPSALTGHSFSSWRTKSQEMEKNEGNTEAALKIASWLRMCKEASNTSVRGPYSTATIPTQRNSMGCRFLLWLHAGLATTWLWKTLKGVVIPLLWNLFHYFEMCCWFQYFSRTVFTVGYRRVSSSWAPGVQRYWSAHF